MSRGRKVKHFFSPRADYEVGAETPRPTGRGKCSPAGSTFLLKRRVDVNAKDSEGETALSSAAGLNQTGIMRMLIRAGADVNARSSARETPLIEALAQASFDAAKVLLAAGADVNARDEDGRTALAIAKGTPPSSFDEQQGYKKIVQLLIRAGAKP